MKLKKLIPFVAASSTFMCASNAGAAVVAQYNFDSAADPLVLSSSDSDTGSTAGNISAGSGAILSRSTTDLFGVNGASFVSIGTNSNTNSLNDAVANNVFFSFTVTAEGGNTLSFTSLEGLVRKSATSSTRGWQLTSSLTGSTILASDSSVSATRSSAFESMSADTSGTLNLSGVTQLQNVSGSVTFTIHSNTGTGTANNSGRTLDYDNIILNATVVPEPSAFILGCLGSLVLIRRKR